MTGNQTWKRHSFLTSVIISSVLVIWLTEEKSTAVLSINTKVTWVERREKKTSLLHKSIKKTPFPPSERLILTWILLCVVLTHFWPSSIAAVAKTRKERKEEEEGSDSSAHTDRQEALHVEACSGDQRTATNKPLRNIEQPHHCLCPWRSYISINILTWLWNRFTIKTHGVPVTDHQNAGIKQPTNKCQTHSDYFQFYHAWSTVTLRACCVCRTLSDLGWRSHKVRVVGWLGEEVCLYGQVALLRLCR